MEWPCTADQLVELRGQGMSWEKIAVELGLGEGKKRPARFARLAYQELTGQHWSEAAPVARPRTAAPKAPPARRASSRLQWDDDTDQDEIEAALLGHEHTDKNGRTKWRCRKVTVERTSYGARDTVTLDVRYATAFTFGPEGDQPLQVEVVEELRAGDYIGTRLRTLFIHKIVKVR